MKGDNEMNLTKPEKIKEDKMSAIIKVICVVLVVAFTFTFVPVSEAKWQDQSDQLPGMDGGSSARNP